LKIKIINIETFFNRDRSYVSSMGIGFGKGFSCGCGSGITKGNGDGDGNSEACGEDTGVGYGGGKIYSWKKSWRKNHGN